MTDITEIPEGGVPSTRELRIFEFLIDGVIAHSCARHYEADTQEHQLTSRIAQAIEHELGNVRIGETRVRIAVQELSDRGRGSKERAVGADLYISIVVESEDESISKGMLVQSKWDHAFSRSSELGRLRDQSHEMLRRSKESYVWVYGARSVSVVPAGDDLTSDVEGILEGGKTVGKLLSDGIACRAGDRAIGRDTTRPLAESLNEKLRELAVDTGLSLIVTATDA